MGTGAGPSMSSVLGVGKTAAVQTAISNGASVASQVMPGTSTAALMTSIDAIAAAAESPRAKALAVTASSAGSSTDLIWHNPTTGQTVSWAMNGAASTSSTVLLQLPNWKVTRTADLNGDGQQDLIWENSSTNQIVAWLMNGTQTLQSTVLLQNADWKITHSADFNGDGKADLLFLQRQDRSDGAVVDERYDRDQQPHPVSPARPGKSACWPTSTVMARPI